MKTIKTIIVCAVIALCAITSANAQVAIGVDRKADENAILELVSQDRGLLLPRVNLVATGFSDPMKAHVAGMLVFNLTDNTQAVANAAKSDFNPSDLPLDSVTSGFYYNDGTQWIRISTSLPAWGLQGNADTDPKVNFVGTTDDVALLFRRNNVQAGKLCVDNTFFGVGAGAAITPKVAIRNTFIGVDAGKDLTTGTNNIFIGPGAGWNVTTGSHNIIIGSDVNADVGARFEDSENELNIGNAIYGLNVGNALPTYIGINDPSPSSTLHIGGSFAVNIILPGTKDVVQYDVGTTPPGGAVSPDGWEDCKIVKFRLHWQGQNTLPIEVYDANDSDYLIVMMNNNSTIVNLPDARKVPGRMYEIVDTSSEGSTIVSVDTPPDYLNEAVKVDQSYRASAIWYNGNEWNTYSYDEELDASNNPTGVRGITGFGESFSNTLKVVSNGIVWIVLYKM